MVRRTLPTLLVVAALLALPVRVAAAVPGPVLRSADVLALFNQERNANGLATVTADSALETGCVHHLAYEEANGGTVGHGEDPGNPGYTDDGANPPGGESLGVQVDDLDTAGFDPDAPIHRLGVMDPAMTATGFATDGTLACQRTLSALPAPGGPYFAWTGRGGPETVATSENAYEAPYTPQELVGIPARTSTGPNLLLMSANAADTPFAATLIGPDGDAVSTHLVNGQTPVPGGGTSPFLTGAGVLFPDAPLAPYSEYAATVTWRRSADGASAQQQFTFTTVGRTNGVYLSLARDTVNADDPDGWFVFAGSTAPNPVVTLTAPDGTASTVPVPGYTVLDPSRDQGFDGQGPAPLTQPGRWRACIASGGRDVGYEPARRCGYVDVPVRLAAPPAPAPVADTAPGSTAPVVIPPRLAPGLKLGTVHRRGRTLRGSGRIAAAAAGRVTVTLSYRVPHRRRTWMRRIVATAHAGRFRFRTKLPRGARVLRVVARYPGDDGLLAGSATRRG